jgi:hypothetical protein
MKKKSTLKAFAFLFFCAISAKAQIVTITNGTTGTTLAPLNHFNYYSANEMIYLQSQINQAGTIRKIGFEKVGGTTVGPITNVSIYMKHTTLSALTAGTFDTTGYTRVFKGDFTNNATTGWMEVALKNPFVYNNTANLSIIFFKKNGSTGANQSYKFGSVSRLATRRATNTTGINTATSLTTSDALPNLRLDYNMPTGVGEAIETSVFSLSPNPTSGLFEIGNTSGIFMVKVLDLTGRVVAVKDLQTGTASLDLTALPAGTYLVQVHTKNAVSVKRLIKE